MPSRSLVTRPFSLPGASSDGWETCFTVLAPAPGARRDGAGAFAPTGWMRVWGLQKPRGREGTGLGHGRGAASPRPCSALQEGGEDEEGTSPARPPAPSLPRALRPRALRGCAAPEGSRPAGGAAKGPVPARRHGHRHRAPAPGSAVAIRPRGPGGMPGVGRSAGPGPGPFRGAALTCTTRARGRSSCRRSGARCPGRARRGARG